MPKKTRKMKQRAAMRRAYQAPGQEQQSTDTIEETAETTVRMRPTTPSSRGVTPLTFDYSHIYGDLKRIAVFAGFFFAVLIVLSFVIK
jgi:hypothetical protein